MAQEQLFVTTAPIFGSHKSIDQPHPNFIEDYFLGNVNIGSPKSTGQELDKNYLSGKTQTEAHLICKIKDISFVKLTNFSDGANPVYGNVERMEMISEDASGKTYKYYLKMNINCSFLKYLFDALLSNYSNESKIEILNKKVRIFNVNPKITQKIKVNRTNYLPRQFKSQQLELISKQKDPQMNFENDPQVMASLITAPDYSFENLTMYTRQAVFNNSSSKYGAYNITDKIPGDIGDLGQESFANRFILQYRPYPKDLGKPRRSIKGYVGKNPDSGQYLMIPSFASSYETSNLYFIKDTSSNPNMPFIKQDGSFNLQHPDKSFGLTEDVRNNDQDIEEYILRYKTDNTGVPGTSDKNFVGCFFGIPPRRGYLLMVKEIVPRISLDGKKLDYYFLGLFGPNLDILTLYNEDSVTGNVISDAKNGRIMIQTNEDFGDCYKNNKKPYLIIDSLIRKFNIGDFDNNVDSTYFYHEHIFRNMYVEGFDLNLPYKKLGSDNKYYSLLHLPAITFFGNEFNYQYYTPFLNKNLTLKYVSSTAVATSNYNTYLASVKNTQNTGLEVAKFQKEKDELIGYGSMLPNIFSLNFAGTYANFVNATAAEIEYQNTIKLQESKNLDVKNLGGTKSFNSSVVSDSIKNNILERGNRYIFMAGYHKEDTNAQIDADLKFNKFGDTNNNVSGMTMMYQFNFLANMPTNPVRLQELSTYLGSYGLYLNMDVNIDQFIPLFEIYPELREQFNDIAYNAGRLKGTQDRTGHKFNGSPALNDVKGAPFGYLDAEWPEEIIDKTFYGLNSNYRKLIKQILQNSCRGGFNKATPENFNLPYELAPMAEWAKNIATRERPANEADMIDPNYYGAQPSEPAKKVNKKKGKK